MNRFFVAITFSFFILNADCQTINFTFESNNLFCNPATVQFKQKCTGNPLSFIWSFGNDKYSNKPNDSTSYAVAGTYTVKLSAIFQNTTLELTKTIVINPAVTAKIGYDRNYICKPGVINFTGSGTGNITNYEWDFGDGTAVVNSPTSNISHTFANFAIDTVRLKTSSAAGCYDTATTLIAIQRLPVTVDLSRIRGCIPAVVDFTATIIAPENSTITSYNWNFGDGTAPYQATTNTVTHIYSAVGNYFPSFVVTSSEGCTNNYTFTNRLYFGTPPTGQVGYAVVTPICGSDSAVFISKATNADRYF
ncbi:MAG: PKD domain-containing protein [Ferruginibacter sp.]